MKLPFYQIVTSNKTIKNTKFETLNTAEIVKYRTAHFQLQNRNVFAVDQINAQMNTKTVTEIKKYILRI